MRINIIARKSALSQIQAQEVLLALQKQYPDIKCNITKREAEGDLDLITPLAHFDQRGIFTREFSEILVTQEADAAVHSWKDLPTENKFDTEITATLPRADARDMLLLKKRSRASQRKALAILSSSPRRAWAFEQNIKPLLPWDVSTINYEPVRGAIPTRIKKLVDSDCDGLVVAKAAMDRLLATELPQAQEAKAYIQTALQDFHWMVLPLKLFPNAPAQGALGIEIHKDRDDLRKLFSRINCSATFAAVKRERDVLSKYGGGCHQKIGVAVQQKPYGTIECITGLTDAGELLNSCTLSKNNLKIPSTQKNLWSSSEISASHFDRASVSASKPSDPALFYITKTSALPNAWKLSEKDLIWSAGITTWQKLAKRGVWVNGSSESLGEIETPDLSLYSDTPVSHIRLTHLDDSVLQAADKKILQTYKLSQKFPIKVPTSVTHCYWTSAYIFECALHDNPHLLHCAHASGPGTTYTRLSALLTEKLEAEKSNVEIFLSEDDWEKAFTE